MRAEAIRRRLEDAEAESSDSEEDEAGADEAAAEADSPEDCYVVPATGARVTMSSAKGLLFHYCTKLPSDKYVLITTRQTPSLRGMELPDADKSRTEKQQ